MQNSWLVLLPPFIVLICTFLTGRLNGSLIAGILSGALIANDLSIPQAITLSLSRLLEETTKSDNIYMYVFLLTISVIIVLLNRTGAALAFAHSITQKLRTPQMAETASLMLSSTLFIDDYLNGLTVGFVMRPITDRFKIPRAKLAFLVHTMTGPLIILAPISSWVAALTGALDQAGISPTKSPQTQILADPFFIYLETIPYIFYSLLIIGSAWFIVRKRISYGSMKMHEKTAQLSGNLFGGRDPIPNKFECSLSFTGSIGDLVWPIAILIGSVIIGNLWSGGYFLLGGTHSLLDAFKNNQETFKVLCISGFITLAFTLSKAIISKKIKTKDLAKIFYDGIHMMMGAIFMVVLALTLGSIIKNDLATGEYLATIVQGSLPLSLMPVLFFAISSTIATVTGSAWGTMFILVPIAVPMLISLGHVTAPVMPNAVPLLFPTLGAIFSGAACGNHLSPIADTTIMTSTSSGCYPIDHTKTQFPYAIPAIISTSIAYLLAGWLAPCSKRMSLIIPLLTAILLCIVILYTLNYVSNKENNEK
jgi:tetracycline resistance efflux pump